MGEQGAEPAGREAEGGAPVLRIAGEPLESARVAVWSEGEAAEGAERGAGSVGSSAGHAAVVEVQRCAASLEVCASMRAWICRVCARRYERPPVRRYDSGGDAPFCLFCGLRVGPPIIRSMLEEPAVTTHPIPPEPSKA